MKEVRFKAGQPIFKQGESSQTTLLLLSGVVEVFVEQDQKVTILGQLSAGEFLGEMGLLDERPRSASARALTDVKAHEMQYPELVDALAEHPAMARRMISRLSSRLRATSNNYVGARSSVQENQNEPLAEPKRSLSVKLFGDSSHLTECISPDGILLSGSEYSVGRAGFGSTHYLHRVVLPDSDPYRLSVNHFLVVSNSDVVSIRDCVSELGTKVNDVMIGQEFSTDQHSLKKGDNVVIAGGEDSPFRFRLVIC
ncbi:MAG: cyclic nucleotide-binding domain-containing protein [Arenicellales bacterium]|jgi:hypothetical protein|nr:cyclic nucleotide-binding domain-containing protein [Arenicellales bacterium]